MAVVEQLMTHAMSIANYVHGLYDDLSRSEPKKSKTGTKAGLSESSGPTYTHYFSDGFNAKYNQTNNCLIIEEHYDPVAFEQLARGKTVEQHHDVMMFALHTPLGMMRISGLRDGHDDEIRQRMVNYLGLKQICPQIKGSCDVEGPYWLITSVNGQAIPHPRIDLLPALSETQLQNDSLDAYRNQFNRFYKSHTEWIKCDEATQQFEAYLDQWIRSGLIADPTGKAIELLDAPEEAYLIGIESLIKALSIDTRVWIRSGLITDPTGKAIKLLSASENARLGGSQTLTEILSANPQLGVINHQSNRVLTMFRIIYKLRGLTAY
jgi:hypothetical protein